MPPPSRPAESEQKAERFVVSFDADTAAALDKIIAEQVADAPTIMGVPVQVNKGTLVQSIVKSAITSAQGGSK